MSLHPDAGLVEKTQMIKIAKQFTFPLVGTISLNPSIGEDGFEDSFRVNHVWSLVVSAH
jgi:hypothetical protein